MDGEMQDADGGSKIPHLQEPDTVFVVQLGVLPRCLLWQWRMQKAQPKLDTCVCG